jgi:TonB family protein
MPLAWVGCASTGSDVALGEPGRTTTRGRPTSGYEVREATEASDTDGLQINLEHGVISQEDAQQAVMAHWKELTHCYSEAGPAMGFADGQVALRFVVDSHGTITDVRIVESKVGNYEVERCLARVGHTVHFPRPRGNNAATVDYTLEFRSTGDLAVVDLAPDAMTAQLPALITHLAGACEGLGADEVMATLYVDGAGTVRSVGLASAASFDETAGRCVADSIRHWSVRLAAIRGGVGRVTVPLRSGDLVVARREIASQPRRYSRTSAGRTPVRRDRSRR